MFFTYTLFENKNKVTHTYYIQYTNYTTNHYTQINHLILAFLTKQFLFYSKLLLDILYILFCFGSYIYIIYYVVVCVTLTITYCPQAENIHVWYVNNMWKGMSKITEFVIYYVYNNYWYSNMDGSIFICRLARARNYIYIRYLQSASDEAVQCLDKLDVDI